MKLAVLRGSQLPHTCLVLPELLDQIPADMTIDIVGGDGACDTRQCHVVIARRNAERRPHEKIRYVLENLTIKADTYMVG